MEYFEKSNVFENEKGIGVIDEFLADFSSESLIEPRDDVRKMCSRCKRPVKACWCQYLPAEKIPLNTTIHILQHPYEKTRCLQTAEMLFQAFEAHRCRLYRGKRFPANKHPELHEVASLPNCLLLFPSNDSIELQAFLNTHSNNTHPTTVHDHSQPSLTAINDTSLHHNISQRPYKQHLTNALDINSHSSNIQSSNHNHFSENRKPLKSHPNPFHFSSPPNESNSSSPPLSTNSFSHSSSSTETLPSHTTPAYHLLVVDGTWHQAKGILFCNPFLHAVTKVHLEHTGVSRYTIRTQPTDQGLSTVESVSLALALLEQRTDIYPALMAPLEALCRTQLEHGAVVHHSKQKLEQLGLKYPMKDNYKLLPEDEEKRVRKKQRKINRLKLKMYEKAKFSNGQTDLLGGDGGMVEGNGDSINDCLSPCTENGHLLIDQTLVNKAHTASANDQVTLSTDADGNDCGVGDSVSEEAYNIGNLDINVVTI